MKALISCDRNLLWLGQMKKSYKLIPLKYVTRINADTLPELTPSNFSIKYIDIGSINSTGEIIQISEFIFGDSPSRARRKVCQGDTIVSTVRTYLKAISYIDEDNPNLIASTGFAVLSPIRNIIYPRYLYYWMRCSFVVDEICARSVGVSYPATNAPEIGSISIARLHIEQQQAIASFLDRKTAAIDTLIAKKQRLIQLLEEKRTALINQAVTKGLNPNVPMKDSGIPWIGDVPEHWKVLRLKFIAEVRGGVAKGRNLKDKKIVELPYLRVANVQDGYLDLSDVATISIEVSEERRYLLKTGDVLMNEGGDDDKLGRGAVWEGQIDRCIHQNHVFAVRPFKSINPHWINLTTQASYLKYFFLIRAKRATNLASISSYNLKEAPILFPPPHEQEETLAKVQKQLDNIQNIYAKVIFQIKKLQEYRQSLITAAVTGKIDIREEVAA
ncbi:restriction endonuclease subunit S [Nostocales cyanobacterium LEGE 12452]|nr:restriction endonuclease subunit S [Nostocales cyanobacterium LEGE 12452]